MFRTKINKKLALAVTVCSLVNVFSFSIPAFGSEIKTFNFDDGILPEEFDSAMFTVENGKLKTTAARSSFKLSDMPKNCSFEFKIKSSVNGAIPKFNAELGNASITYTNDYTTNNSWDDNIKMYNRITWGAAVSTVWANGEGDMPADTFFKTNGKEYTLRYDSYEGKHDLYIDGLLVISGECAGTLDSYDVAATINNAASGIYLDDISVKELTQAPEAPTPDSGEEDKPEQNDNTYNYNFDDGILPEEFDSAKFSVEDGKLKTIAATSSFSFPNVTKNCSFEFKFKAAGDASIPKFNAELGNASITYINDYVTNNAWDDNIKMYNRVVWGAEVSKVWANGEGNIPADTFFPKNGKEYTLRFDSYENKHDLYIDSVLVISGECAGTLNSYNVAFNIYNAAQGVYIDDLVVKELTQTPEAPTPDTEEPDEPADEPETSGNTYIYTFDDGNLPKEFGADVYSVEDGRLKVNSSNGSFTLKDVPRNGSIEFRIEPVADCIIPHLTLSLRTCDLSYTANYVQDKSWDDAFKLRNAENNWTEFANAWAGGTFFPEKDGGHTVKFVADGDTYTLYIDNVQIVSADCPTVSDKESFDLTLLHSDGKGVLKNVGFYLDDIIVKGIYSDWIAGEPSLPELSPSGSTELYSQDFDTLTELPSAGNGTDYQENRLENGALYAIAGEGFIIPSVYSNHKLEMDIQAGLQDKLKIKIALKKNRDGYKYEVVYEDTDTSVPGSKWTFIKKDSDGEDTLAMVERDVDDITSAEVRNLRIECFSNMLAVYIDNEPVADSPASMLKGVDYSSWAYTEFNMNKYSDNEEAVIIDNIRLIGFPMDISDAVTCTGQTFMNADDEVVSSISELTPGKVKVSANAASIDIDFSRDITAIMVMFKDGYLIKAAAKQMSLPKMSLLPAKRVPIELEMEVTENDLAGGNTQIEFYVWDNLNDMTSCHGLSKLN